MYNSRNKRVVYPIKFKNDMDLFVKLGILNLQVHEIGLQEI